MIPPAAIVFDFDGVVADSELIANRTLADALTAIGLATTFEDCLRDYCGHNWREVETRVEVRLGRALPAEFREQSLKSSRAAFERELAPVPGVSEFLEWTGDIPKAIASSSSVEWLTLALERMCLAHYFGAHLYSADGLKRGKPHPGIYLAAAGGLGVAPERCVAVEDSPVGARSAAAAGMTVIGLLAGGHIHDRTAHSALLINAGAHFVADSFAELQTVIARGAFG